MEWEIIKQLAELGGGYVLAGLIFAVYRIDRKASEKRLSGLLEADQNTRTQQTAVMTEVIVLLKNHNNGRN